MADQKDALPSEQEMTDTAEEDEILMDTSGDSDTQTLAQLAAEMHDESNSSRELDDTESIVSTDREYESTPTMPTAPPPAASPSEADPATPRKEAGTPRRPLPFRQGIRWRNGERVEAMDYLSKWYPAKIMDIDVKDCLVLIHFEGWNQRYDEWVAMTSEGIRPLVRHSGRKERGKRDIREYKVGEKVLAKWTDCKMYPAKVVAVNPNGSLEVVFYDGFQKTVQVVNVKTCSDRRQFKVSPTSPETKKFRKKDEGTTVNTEKVRSTSLDEKDRDVQDRKRKPKLIVAGSFLAKRDRSHSAPGLMTKPRDEKPKIKRNQFGLKSSPVALKKVSSGRIQKAIVSRMSSVKIKKELLVAKKSTSGAVERRGKKRALSLPTEDGGPSFTQTSGNLIQPPSSAPAVPAKRFKSTDKDKGLAPKEFVIQPDHNTFKCIISGCAKSFRKESLLDYHLKYYHVDDARTPQHPVPRTKRRKTSSICSTDSDISVCSKGKITPGDGSGSKRKRNISSASDILKQEPIHDIKKEVERDIEDEKVPAASPSVVLVPMTPPPVDVGVHDIVDVTMPEELQGPPETEDEVVSEEVVNCVCGFNEENGLMIQCDVCLCWQHASCFSIKFDFLPSKYICFVCENPPGIRDSRRYIHDQDWHKLGKLRSFNFLNIKQPEDKCDIVKATNSLIADVFNVKAVLHSLRQQNKVSSEESHPEMQTWRRICEEKRRKARIISAKTAAEAQTEQKPDVIKTEAVQAEGIGSAQSPEVKEEPLSEEQSDDKHAVKLSLEKKSPERMTGDLKEEETTANHGSLDLSGSSLERPYEKLRDTSMADNDSDTSTMTASESSTGYMSAFNTGAHGFEDDMHSEDVKDRSGQQDKEWKDERLSEELHEDDASDPLMFEGCERSLLLHIVRAQSDLGDRLELLEDQIEALERSESGQLPPPPPPPASQPPGNSTSTSTSKTMLGDVPVLKRSLHSLVRDLNKVKTMASYH